MKCYFNELYYIITNKIDQLKKKEKMKLIYKKMRDRQKFNDIILYNGNCSFVL